MIKRFCLSTLFLVASFIHFLSPEIFYPSIPDFLIFKYEIVIATGLIELVLGLGLLHSKSVNLASRASSYYLMALLPVHFYVSIYQIEIFGIKEPAILWFRTLLQFYLIYVAYRIDSKAWVIEQRWKDVVFLHYKISPEHIAHLVPYPLDLFEGDAIVSIVPFKMDHIRFPFLPIVPWISKLWELNIRTYVNVNGVKGVYFFTLETDSRLGTFLATHFFSLPYRYSQIKAAIHKDFYQFSHQRHSYSFSLEAKVGQVLSATPFTTWATERYSLFTKKGNEDWQGTVMHEPWVMESVEIIELKDDFSKMVTRDLGKPMSMSYSNELRVRFKPFKKVSH